MIGAIWTKLTIVEDRGIRAVGELGQLVAKIASVGSRQNRVAAATHQVEKVRQKLVWMRHVLDHFGSHDDVEGLLETQLEDIAGLEVEGAALVFEPDVSSQLLPQIVPCDVVTFFSECKTEVTLRRSQIQYSVLVVTPLVAPGSSSAQTGCDRHAYSRETRWPRQIQDGRTATIPARQWARLLRALQEASSFRSWYRPSIVHGASVGSAVPTSSNTEVARAVSATTIVAGAVGPSIEMDRAG